MSFDQGFGDVYGKSLNLKVGRIRGIEIWIHWILLFLFAVLLLHNYLRLAPAEHPFTRWLVFVAAILLSVLVHELGHCYAAFRQGGGADRVLLWPLGGLAYCTAPHEPRSQFWVAAGGPLADVIKALAAAAVCLSLGWDLLPSPAVEQFSAARLFFQDLFLWNSFLLALNLLPCLPLDGGRMFQALSWSVLESHGAAMLLTLRVSRFAAITALAAGAVLFFISFANQDFAFQHPFLYHLTGGLVLVGLVHFSEARAIRHRLAYGDEDESIFGYDFSNGYTSLERTATRRKKRASLLGAMRERLRRRDVEHQRQHEMEMRQRLDRVLEKISREGMESLSREEQRFLTRASKELRK